jgi:hypothetical protein
MPTPVLIDMRTHRPTVHGDRPMIESDHDRYTRLVERDEFLDDPLREARGIINGLIVSVALWGAIIAAVVLWT